MYFFVYTRSAANKYKNEYLEGKQFPSVFPFFLSLSLSRLPSLLDKIQRKRHLWGNVSYTLTIWDGTKSSRNPYILLMDASRSGDCAIYSSLMLSSSLSVSPILLDQLGYPPHFPPVYSTRPSLSLHSHSSKLYVDSVVCSMELYKGIYIYIYIRICRPWLSLLLAVWLIIYNSTIM